MLPIGQVAQRTGLSVSAIRFYEDRGLITAGRNAGGQRRFHRSDIRRLSFVKICQTLGFSIADIRAILSQLPAGCTPTKRDWTKLSAQFRHDLDRRITQMQALRDRLDGCIGCGCLSMEACKLYNPDDTAGDEGSGPRFLLE